MVFLRDRFIQYCITNYYFKVVKMSFYRLCESTELEGGTFKEVWWILLLIKYVDEK